MNQLGTLAKHGVQVVIHNTLAASDYALIDETTLTPRPNYWSAVLWRRLMGTTVLDAGNAPQQPGLYLYAHCLRGHPGGTAILAINADKTASKEISLPAAYTLYTLTANDLMDTNVMLNGVELKLTSSGNLPALDGVQHKGGTITLNATSIAFLAIPESHNQACR